MLHSPGKMDQPLGSVVGINSLVDIAIVAVLIYWLFILIRGTRAVSLVIGVTVLFAVYAAARFFGLQLLTQILQAGPSSGCSRSSSSSSRSCGGPRADRPGRVLQLAVLAGRAAGRRAPSPTRSPTPRRSSRPMAMGRSSSSSVTPASRKWRRPA